MKRFVLLSAILILTIPILTSCIIIPQFKRFEIATDTVTSIEIYDLHQVDTLYGNFIETQTPVYESPQEENTDFLNDLAEIRFTDSIVIALVAMDPSFYYDDWTVRINYVDDSFQLVSSDGYGQTYDKSGEVIDTHHFGCDQKEWWAFIGKYVPESIFNHPHETNEPNVKNETIKNY